MDFDESIAYETIITETYDQSLQEFDHNSPSLSTTQKANTNIHVNENILNEKINEISKNKLSQPVGSSSSLLVCFPLLKISFVSLFYFRFL